MNKELSTEPYKGTRDFYPTDMAVQRYIFDTWARSAELFGFERYDASILEPAELYRSKTSEEIVNEQTYTFVDRGDREVTLRPEMTPTVARMISHKRRELSFPVRWYSIPNLFRYERPQRGRLREHWQLNCDIFGKTDISADIETIALAHHVLTSFGATPDMFEIRVNDRALMHAWYTHVCGLSEEQIKEVTRIVDRKKKVSAEEFQNLLSAVTRDPSVLIEGLGAKDPHELRSNSNLPHIFEGLQTLGVTNVVYDATIARGFDYYTGMVFEIFDTAPDNNRSILGGGRYDNLTGLFGGDPIPGVGFGMGDVVISDFLDTHALLPNTLKDTGPTLVIAPMEVSYNIDALRIAHTFRAHGISTSVDTSTRKIGKKIGIASDQGVRYIVAVGENEVTSGVYTLKNLKTAEEKMGTIEELASAA